MDKIEFLKSLCEKCQETACSFDVDEDGDIICRCLYCIVNDYIESHEDNNPVKRREDET